MFSWIKKRKNCHFYFCAKVTNCKYSHSPLGLPLNTFAQSSQKFKISKPIVLPCGRINTSLVIKEWHLILINPCFVTCYDAAKEWVIIVYALKKTWVEEQIFCFNDSFSIHSVLQHNTHRSILTVVRKIIICNFLPTHTDLNIRICQKFALFEKFLWNDSPSFI